MPWFLYYMDLFRPVDFRAYTINDAVRAGAEIIKEILNNVNKYCIYENGEILIIEYWSKDSASAKLINVEEPALALEQYYEAERVGLVECSDLG
ncbi:MAG: hypothetical protein ACP5NQ_09535 [Vulcanisaeta sp.]